MAEIINGKIYGGKKCINPQSITFLKSYTKLLSQLLININ